MSKSVIEWVVLISTILLLVGPFSVASLQFDEEHPTSRDGPRAFTIDRIGGVPPTIDGIFASTSEWEEATLIEAGVDSNNVKLYLTADGEFVYVLVDIVSDIDLDPEPPPYSKDYTFMLWDGDNDGNVTYPSGSAGSDPISKGGDNADFAMALWGDGSFWNYSVMTQDIALIVNTGAQSNTPMVASFGSSPNSGTAHRILEYMIPYDGPYDELGCSVGYPFTKGFNLLVYENDTDTEVKLGALPPSINWATDGYDTVTLPQKFPHITDVVSPRDGALFFLGHNIKFKINVTDNNLSTLDYTLYLNDEPFTMVTDQFIKSDLPAGTYNISFRIEDDEGLNDTIEGGTIMVAEPPVPPVIDSYGPSSDPVEIDEGDEVVFTVDWYDLNLDQANESVMVNWTIDAGPADPALINETPRSETHHTTNLTFRTDHGSEGAYSIKLELTDSYFDSNSSVNVSWELHVHNVNRRPVILDPDPGTSGVIGLLETASLNFTIGVDDPDGDDLTSIWYVDGGEQAAYENHLTFTFNDDPPDYDLSGDHVVKAVVSDGELASEVHWNVTVLNVNLPPQITEMSPGNGTILLHENENVTFLFQAMDPDIDALSYTWSVNDDEVMAGTDEDSFTFVTVFLSSDGNDASMSPYVIRCVVTDGEYSKEHEWEVTVENVNRPPVPVIDHPREGQEFSLSDTIPFHSNSSHDPDGDGLTYEWDLGIGRTMEGMSQSHRFDTIGDRTVTLTVSDGHVEMKGTVNITILFPRVVLEDLFYDPRSAKEGDSVTFTVTIGNVGNADAEDVEVLFFKGVPSNEIATVTIPLIEKDGSVEINVTWEAEVGSHNIFVRIEQSERYEIDGDGSGDVRLSVHEKPNGGDTGDLGPYLSVILAIIIVLVITVTAFVLGRRRRIETDEDRERTVTRPCEGCGAQTTSPERMCATCRAAGVELKGAGPKAGTGPSKPAEGEVEEFSISEMFLIYKDGRLVKHLTIEEGDDSDKDLISSMLIAIQGFVRESFQEGLNSFEFGKKKVIILGGKHLILAAVLEGTEPPVLRDDMQSIIYKIEGLYAGVVEDWDGQVDHFKDVTPHMVTLFRLRSKLRIRKKKRRVRVKSGVEFYSGYVRIKVGVSNELEGPIRDLLLTLKYDKKTLKLSHIEPDYPISGSVIDLQDVEPKEKRTVAVYFDPIICQESHIDGWVTYSDPKGDPGEAKMKRRPVDVVCPIFYTTETVNVAMLKRLLEKLDYQDSKIYHIETRPTLRIAYKLAKAAVGGHDVKFVREFEEKEKGSFEVETWYYGEVKESDEKIVIKVTAREARHYLEILVASSNLASMTGLLAELGNEVRGKMGEKEIMKDEFLPSTEKQDRDRVEHTVSLLDKYWDQDDRNDQAKQGDRAGG